MIILKGISRPLLRNNYYTVYKHVILQNGMEGRYYLIRLRERLVGDRRITED